MKNLKSILGGVFLATALLTTPSALAQTGERMTQSPSNQALMATLTAWQNIEAGQQQAAQSALQKALSALKQEEIRFGSSGFLPAGSHIRDVGPLAQLAGQNLNPVAISQVKNGLSRALQNLQHGKAGEARETLGAILQRLNMLKT